MNYDAVVRLPIGVTGIRADTASLCAIDFLANDASEQRASSSLAADVVAQLQCYFDDPSWEFELPLEPQGTAHQQRVWQALCETDAGKVLTYGELAARLGSGARAVGNACRHNPIPIVIPCHRVVAASGIGGYAGDYGGGLVNIKDQLLRHEDALPATLF